VSGIGDAREALIQPIGYEREEQLVLAGEAGVDGALGQSGLRGHLVQRCAVVARAVIADFFERHAAATGDQLSAPAADLAVVAMALSNGLAMEYIADPGSADPALFARTLAQLVTV
jgi:hypothetical protein